MAARVAGWGAAGEAATAEAREEGREGDVEAATVAAKGATAATVAAKGATAATAAGWEEEAAAAGWEAAPAAAPAAGWLAARQRMASAPARPLPAAVGYRPEGASAGCYTEADLPSHADLQHSISTSIEIANVICR